LFRRLHEEICRFYDFVRPYDYEEESRADLINRVQVALMNSGVLEPGRVLAFGSYPAGLYLPTADMDLVFVSDSFSRTGLSQGAKPGNNVLRKVQRALMRADITTYSDSQCIFGAKVPIIKFLDRHTRLHVDISFDNLTGVNAIATFAAWKTQYPAAIYLIAVLKQFLLMRNLNEVFNGGLGGFSICCLVVSLLQNHNAIRDQSFVPEQHLGQLLVEFFDLYGNQFNMATTGIKMNPPGYFAKDPEIIGKVCSVSIYGMHLTAFRSLQIHKDGRFLTQMTMKTTSPVALKRQSAFVVSFRTRIELYYELWQT
jgi:non-canonical poly(A) RNA polymerase PAPD5/7